MTSAKIKAFLLSFPIKLHIERRGEKLPKTATPPTVQAAKPETSGVQKIK